MKFMGAKDKKYFEKIAQDIRIKIIEMLFNSKSSHLGSSLSIVDIITFLYFGFLNIDPENPDNPDRDRFILSKGHACSALYAALAMRGFFPVKLLEKYCINNGLFSGHCTFGIIPGIEASTGSLGHGLPMGIGMAIAGRNLKNKYRVFVLLSDGECNEGSVWEAAMFAGHHKLDNLTAIIDFNGLQALGYTKDILNLEPFLKKWESFGWEAIEVDGHNFLSLKKAFSKIPIKESKPSLIVAKTIKGKGVSFAENRIEWHYKSLSKDQYEIAINELK